jgi:hypothetical protein
VELVTFYAHGPGETAGWALVRTSVDAGDTTNFTHTSRRIHKQIKEANRVGDSQNECVQVFEGGCAPGDECVDALQTFDYTHGDTTRVCSSQYTSLCIQLTHPQPIHALAIPHPLPPQPPPPHARPHILAFHTRSTRHIICARGLWRNARSGRQDLDTSGHGQHADSLRAERHV